MENIEERRINPVSISPCIPEEDLILMFPFTYVEYRIMMSTDDSFGAFLSLGKKTTYTANEEITQSFKSFLSFMGPLPEDTQKAH